MSLFFTACAQAQVASPTPLPSNDWSAILHPNSGTATPIGFYSKGCISGASTLPLDGTGYQVMRVNRNRYYGHPEMMDFITSFGRTLSALGSGILIGDVGQARGGPMPYGHTSHQVGLDVDIWFWTHPEQNQRSLSEDERNNLPMPLVLNSNGLVDPSKFTAETIQKLKIAVADPRVERVFVNPAIKTYLCSTLPIRDLTWLHKLRPWPGHDEHFHVRLSCPTNVASCVHQDPQPPGDGCDELIPPRRQSKAEIKAERDEHIDPILEKVITDPLPPECTKVQHE